MRTATIVPLADIAKRMKVKPRLARIRLRRAFAGDRKLPQPVTEQRWAWPKSQVKRIEECIRG